MENTNTTTTDGATAVLSAMVRTAHIIDAATRAVDALQSIRDEIPEDEFEALEMAWPQLADLMSAAVELEHLLESPLN
jgi:hypothetical protein